VSEIKKIGIYFFSGTGFTGYVTERLSGEFKKRGISVDRIAIKKTKEGDFSGSLPLSAAPGYDAIGIAYPVHSFNAPKIVINFAGQLPTSNGVDTFIIHTAGEDNWINYSSSNLLIRKLNKKGYRVFYNKLVEMPSNFIVKYDDSKAEGMIEKVKEDIPQIAQDIIGLKPLSMNGNLISKLISVLGRAEWPGAHMLGKWFYTKAGCTRCGKCADNCPNQNIEMTDKAVRFKWRCGLCMKCIYLCPVSVISIRQPFKFICFDSWYAPDLLEKNK